ncbi:MAG: hypothetical protein HY675_09025 [Chloroflexi bacterium]|nr:hypothetical protein [Chloroflexota bacterium]
MKVTITALQSVRRALGWSSQELEFSGRTLAELLACVQTEDGRSLYEVLVDESGISQKYALLVNGSPVPIGNGKALQAELADGDQVVAMALIRVVRGG